MRLEGPNETEFDDDDDDGATVDEVNRVGSWEGCWELGRDE